VKLHQWYSQRGPGYIRQRAAALLDRYGITPTKAIGRVMSNVAVLDQHGCAPTFPTPGRVVERNPVFFHRLQEAGAEIAVHAYDHVDLSAYPPEQARQQLVRAAETFDRHGLHRHGFRCPYLGCTDSLLDSLPEGLFSYSSNQAIQWDISPPERDGGGDLAMLEVLQRVYKPLSAQQVVCVPWSRPNLVEIPVTLPDDLTLHDGLQIGPQGLAQAWRQILQHTHQRGECFVLMYHPELAARCLEAFKTILSEAASRRPRVWIARLSDIGLWWREKASFSIEASATEAGLPLSFMCSDRATILVRGLTVDGSGPPWDGKYRHLRAHTLEIPDETRPFLGLPANTPADTVTFLREQGYILDLSENAPRCATYLDASVLEQTTSQVELVSLIEDTTGPMIRYWRWPDGAKSCLSITGDLDALTLVDYTARLFVR
jgi:peptidoglycan/xylan/chitin deacetylase (PgdA/CDA1 family)